MIPPAGPANSLIPQGASPEPMAHAAQAAPPGAPSGPTGGPSALDQNHGQAAAAFAQTGKAMKKMENIKSVLAPLVAKGDLLTEEDIMGGATSLVSKGEDPKALAGILADMPTGSGPALAQWLQGLAAKVEQNEQQLAQQHEQARHELAVASLHGMVQHSTSPYQQEAPQAPPDAGGLMPGPGGPPGPQAPPAPPTGGPPNAP